MDVLVRKADGQYAVIAASASATAEPLVLLPPKRLSAAGVIIAKRGGAAGAAAPPHPLARLPTALTRQYMSWLDPASLCNVAGASRDLFAAAADDEVWKRIAAQLWPVQSAPPTALPTIATTTATAPQTPPTITPPFASQLQPPVAPPLGWKTLVVNRHNLRHTAAALWERIRAQLKPYLRGTLLNGVTPTEWRTLEKAYPQFGAWPEHLRVSLSCVDGQEDGLGPTTGLLDGGRLLSAAEIVIEHKLFVDSQTATTATAPASASASASAAATTVADDGFDAREWLPVTAASGHQRLLVHRTRGDVWLQSGVTSFTRHRMAHDWLLFLAKAFGIALPPYATAI